MDSTKIQLPIRLERILQMASDEVLQAQLLETLAAVYRSMMLKRYKTFAAGGGNWKPLSPVTIERRRKGKGKGSDKILIDTGGLIQAVGAMTHVGAKNTRVGSVITVGFSDASHDGGDTYNQIASLHQNGGWTVIDGKRVFVPQRKILVKPDEKQVKTMESKVKNVVKKYMEK